MSDTERETHIDDELGLFVPKDLREFDAQIVFRTPRATIQHFGSDPLDGYYGMIRADQFGDPEEFEDPKNPDLAPDRVKIKPQGEDAVTLTVDTESKLRTDGGRVEGHTERWDDTRQFMHRVFVDEPTGVAESVDDVPVCPTCLRAFEASKYGPDICEDCWDEHISRSGEGGRRYITEHGDKKHYTPLCPHVRGSQYWMTSDESCVYGRRSPCGTCGPGGRGQRVMTDGGPEASSVLFDRWMAKADENIAEWGLQDERTLLLAMQEEMGEVTQAVLEASAEDGDPERIGEELDDLDALLLQFHEARNHR